jgi:hypothetical protein
MHGARGSKLNFVLLLEFPEARSGKIALPLTDGCLADIPILEPHLKPPLK